MTKMQEKLLEMFVWFHDFCKENDLAYYAVGGTVLGTIRHHGFIPWDDDMDVGMPREDYEKLRILAKEQNDAKYEFEFPGDKKDYVYPFGKIYDRTTTMIDEKRHNVRRGIYIDIFPLDGGGNTEETALKQCKSLKGILNLHWAMVCPVKKDRNPIINGGIMLVRCIPGFILNLKTVLNKIELKCKKYSFDDGEYAVNFVGVWKTKEIMKREWFGEPTLHKFEGVDIYCPENYDAYLTQMYGDYMTLPPESKRKSEHKNIYIDLNSSYLE